MKDKFHLFRKTKKFARPLAIAVGAVAAILILLPLAEISPLSLFTGTTGLIGMAVTAGQLVERQGTADRRGGPVNASTTLYAGTMVFVTAGGYLDDTAGGAQFFGIAVDTYDNSAGASGDIQGECWTSGAFLLTGSGFAQSDVGSLIYASDNYTVTTTSTSNSLIGRIKEFKSATQVWVELEANADQ